MLLVLTFTIPSITNAQNTENPTIINPKNADKNEALTANQFLESVLVVRRLGDANSRSKTKKALEIELVNFNSSKKFLPAYLIDGIEYNDNGKFNDKIAGDGIFTSVTKHLVKGVPVDISEIGSIAAQFKYQNQLKNYKSSTRGLEVTFSCKTRIVVCPETSWWNNCWPLSSPCTCVEFYDCEVSVTID